jgi:hypothetical protein
MGSVDASKGSYGMQAVDEGRELRPGTARPGPVGLLIRVVLGAASIWGLVELVTNWDVFRDQDLIESDFWFITLFTLCLLPDVFNIGCGGGGVSGPSSSSWPAPWPSGRLAT